MVKERLSTLVLALVYPHRASYYTDWQQAFLDSPVFETTLLNVARLSGRQLERELARVELVVLLHSCTADSISDLSRLAPALANRKHARLVAMVGNEFNSPHIGLRDKIALLAAIGPDVIATQLLLEAGEFLYGRVGARVMSLPHALNARAFSPGAKSEARPIDVGFRGERYYAFIGDDSRVRLIDTLLAQGPELGLALDIDWKRRFDRPGWVHFLQSCRGTVGAEAGSWYLDHDDSLVLKVYDAARREQRGYVISDDHGMRQIFRRLPLRVKDAFALLLRKGPVRYSRFEDERISYEDVQALFSAAGTKCKAYSKCISSRHFDAIGTKTCQIMVRGRFNDILVADEHYVAVNPDLADLRGAVERFNDPGERDRIVERAYQYVMDAHTYPHRLAQLHTTLMSGE